MDVVEDISIMVMPGVRHSLLPPPSIYHQSNNHQATRCLCLTGCQGIPHTCTSKGGHTGTEEPDPGQQQSGCLQSWSPQPRQTCPSPRLPWSTRRRRHRRGQPGCRGAHSYRELGDDHGPGTLPLQPLSYPRFWSRSSLPSAAEPINLITLDMLEVPM